jgi:hypothetical protein
MRVLSAVLALALFSACAADTRQPPLPNDQIRARFPAGGIIDVIEIDAVDRLPLRTAELVAPDGQATPAFYLHVDASPGVAFHQRVIDAPYPSSAFGLGEIASGTMFPADVAGAPQGDARLLAMASTASIRLPDEVAYRKDWRSYRIFLSFGDPPAEIERRVLPGPEPPPNR